jgi:hypothetical protein
MTMIQFATIELSAKFLCGLILATTPDRAGCNRRSWLRPETVSAGRCRVLYSPRDGASDQIAAGLPHLTPNERSLLHNRSSFLPHARVYR